MSMQLTNGRFQAFDSAGDPLIGGKLYTYDSGTTNPRTTWSDAGLTTPNANPVLMDARGEAIVFLGAGAYSFALKDAAGVTIWTVDGVQDNSSANLTSLAGSGGASLVGFIQAGSGAIARTLQDKGRDVLDARDFGVSASNPDNSTQLQNFFNACSSGTPTSPRGVLPPGTIQFASPLVPPSLFFKLQGQGQDTTFLKYTGTSGSAIAPAAMTFWRPSISDLTIDAGTSSGHAIDTSNVSSQVFMGSFERLTLAAGGNALHMPHVFSFKFDTVRASSSAGHSFLANCGPAVTWINCYAVSAGTGKCGYRLAGEALMIGCNGVDTAERWGVFGSNNAASDGFQSDFPSLTDFPRVTMIGCNVEAFSVEGIRLHNSYRRFLFEGGKIDRSAFSTAYTAVLTICAQGVDINTPIRLNPSFYSPGSGTPTNGAGSQFWVQSGSVCVVDVTGDQLGKVFDSTVSGGTLVPMVNLGVAQDVFGGRALNLNAASIGRAQIGTLNFKTGAFTPVGTGQVIDVTGITKAVIGAVAPSTSISKATFTTTVGADLDNGRNGELYIEATNGNLTILNGGGADNFKLTAGGSGAGADLTLYAGQVVHFVRNSAGFWSQQ